MTITHFHEALKQGFIDATPHAAVCGMQVTESTGESVELLLPFREDWLGDTERRIIHTGVIAVLIDSACGAAILGAMGHFEPIATIDLRIDYLRSARRDLPLHCRARCLRLTSTIAFAQATAWQDQPDEPVAIAQGAFMRSMAPKPASRGA